MASTEQKPVTLESLLAASDLIATKEVVDEKIRAAALGGVEIKFATTEEVLALFQTPKAEQ